MPKTLVNKALQVKICFNERVITKQCFERGVIIPNE